MSSDPWSVQWRPSARGQRWAMSFFPSANMKYVPSLADDAHVLDPRAGEDRVVGVAGPVNAVGRRGVAQGHRRRRGRRRSRCTRGDTSRLRRPGYSRARGSCGPRCPGPCRRRPGCPGSASRRPMARRESSAGGRAAMVAAAARSASKGDQAQSMPGMCVADDSSSSPYCHVPVGAGILYPVVRQRERPRRPRAVIIPCVPRIGGTLKGPIDWGGSSIGRAPRSQCGG